MEYLDHLKALKEKRDLTYAEIAEISDLPLTTVTRVFSGATPNPTFETIARLTIALGGSLDGIAGLKQTNSHPIPTPIEKTFDSYAELLKVKDERINDLKEEVKEVRKEKHRFSLALAIIVAFLLSILAVDLFNGNFGYFRY